MFQVTDPVEVKIKADRCDFRCPTTNHIGVLLLEARCVVFVDRVADALWATNRRELRRARFISQPSRRGMGALWTAPRMGSRGRPATCSLTGQYVLSPFKSGAGHSIRTLPAAFDDRILPRQARLAAKLGQ